MIAYPTRRRVLVIAGAVALLAAAVVGARNRSRIDTSRTYRIGRRDNTLSKSIARDGRVDGLGVAVVAEAARRAGIRLEWVDSPEGGDKALATHRVEMWPMLGMLPERKKKFHITEPWIVNERCLVTDGIPRTDWHHVPVAYGLGPLRLLSANLEGAVPVYKSDEIAALQMVCTKEAAGAFVSVHSLGALILRRPEGCEKVKFEVTPYPSTSLGAGLASVRELAPVADGIRSRIEDMANDGTLRSMFQQYGIFAGSEHEIIYQLGRAEQWSRLLTYGSAALVLTMGILIWQIRRVRESRQAAQHANQAKSEFLANMSHEIRTPLNGIAGMLEILSQTKMTADQREMVAVMQMSSESLITIVNDILDLSKIEAGAMQAEEVAFDLRANVQGVAKLLAPRAQAKGLAFEVWFHEAVPRSVKGDPLRLRQVLLNLISNAIKFTETGRIRLEVLPAGDHNTATLFRVIDTGIGIDAKSAARLFDPFTQADSATTRKYGGTGLGLTISRRLAMLMGGSIGVESAAGSGSTFWLAIPLAAVDREPEAAAPEQTESPGPPGNRGAVLVVDDNPINQIVAVKALHSLGYETSVAGSGEAALKAIADTRFDIVLMDCQMPGMDGYQTASEIRRREGAGGRIPIVAMTANAGDQERCSAAGMDDYLGKPIRLSALRETMECWVKPQSFAGAASRPPASPTLPGLPIGR